MCQEEVLASPNPRLRRVEVSVFDCANPERRIIKLVQLVLRRADEARARGFTLIELLVAISILAIVAVLGWRGLDGIVRARVALTDQMETTRGMQLAFAQMQSDCEHMADADAAAEAALPAGRRRPHDAGAQRVSSKTSLRSCRWCPTASSTAC